MAKYSLPAALKNRINKAAETALAGAGTEIIKQLMQEAIQDEVYDAYNNPHMVYERRMENGGLMDRDNIVGTVKGGTLLEVENITPPNPDYGASDGKGLPATVEYGLTSEYDYYDPTKTGQYFANPRPFVEETRRLLNEHSKNAARVLLGAFKDAMK